MSGKEKKLLCRAKSIALKHDHIRISDTSSIKMIPYVVLDPFYHIDDHPVGMIRIESVYGEGFEIPNSQESLKLVNRIMLTREEKIKSLSDHELLRLLLSKDCISIGTYLGRILDHKLND